MLNVAEHVTLIKAVLARPKPLNIQAPPPVNQSQLPVSQPSTAVSQSPTLTNPPRMETLL